MKQYDKLQIGDIIVLSSKERFSFNQKLKIINQVRFVFPGNKIIILDNNMKLQIIKKKRFQGRIWNRTME